MRKIILSIAATSAAVAAASPAAAQYYGGPQRAPYGYNGYNNGFGEVRALQARIDNVERQINRLDRRDRIGGRSADRLREEADGIEHRLHERARGGLNPYEMRDIEVRIARLEQRVQYSMNDRRGYGDRDGRWDRDHDRDGDGGWDRDHDRN
jgi:hypothetical protein